MRRLHHVASSIEADFERARQLLGHTIDLALVKPLIDGSPVLGNSSSALVASDVAKTTLPSAPLTINGIYDRYFADPRHCWSRRTAVAHATTKKWIVEAFGANTEIAEITREGCREFVDLLRQMPVHADKRFPKMGMREAVAAAKAHGERRIISTANINAYLNRFGGMMNWAVEEGYINRNPMKGLKLHDPVKRRDKRHPFSIEQLQSMFDAPLYRGCENDKNGYAIVGDQQPRRARFWVPLIALFSGLRLNEICQLEVSDVQKIDGLPCFSVASGISATGDLKRVKTSASERIVPIHKDLISFGFLSFIDTQKLSGEKCLFPELPLGHLGYRATSFSRWFSRFLISAGSAEPLTCFHSFRHCFRDALREAKVDRDVALILGGWTTGGKGSSVADNYGRGYGAVVLSEAINLIGYPALDLDHLSAINKRETL